MRSARSATIAWGLALWAVLALAPVIGACMDGHCAPDEGVRSAHCGMPATVMLCCEEAPDQQAPASFAPEVRVVELAARLAPEPKPDEHAQEPTRAVAFSAHGPPLYRLFDTLLI